MGEFGKLRPTFGRRHWSGVPLLTILLSACATPARSMADSERLEKALSALTRSIERLNERIDKLEREDAPSRAVARSARAKRKTTPAPTAEVERQARAASREKEDALASTQEATAVVKQPPKAAPTEPTGKFVPDAELFVCPRIKVSNRPHINKTRKIIYYRPFVRVNEKVDVAVAPQNGACLTSGFGKRRGKKHKGVDYQSRPAPMIHAAASGTIVEAEFRDDYGNMVVIDHGDGVFTRYAHLRRLEKGIKVGRKVPFGSPLGPMGNTAKWKLPLHLHYEILTGNYDTPKKSFGLKPKDPFWLLFESRPRNPKPSS